MNTTPGPYAGHWSTHQLTEYFAAVSTPDDEDEVLRVAIERAGECLEAELGAVVLDGHLVSSVGFGLADPPSELVTLAPGVSTSVLPGVGEVHYLTARMDGPGWPSSAVAGRIVAGRLDASFVAEEEQMLQAMATVLGLVLRNLRSLAAERARQNLLSSLLDVQRSISARRPLQEVLDAVTGATSRLLGVATASLVLKTDSGLDSLQVVSRHGLVQRPDDPLSDPAVAVGAAQLALERGALVGADGDEVTVLADIVAVPVRVNSESTGALVAWRAGWGMASGLHAELLTMFAQQVSVALTDAHTVAKMQEALRDSLTGLASRSLFHDRLGHACTVARRRAEPLSLLFLDLDGFKAVNDTHGHAAGDAVLVEVSRRLAAQLRASDTAARLGGDEFVVLVEGASAADALELAERIVAAVDCPIVLDALELRVGVSVGIADGDAGRLTPDEIVALADRAMYAAKRSCDRHVVVHGCSAQAETSEVAAARGEVAGTTASAATAITAAAANT